MIASGTFYKKSDAAAEFCGITEAEFLRAVENGHAPRPIASNVPDMLRQWRAADLRDWMARKAKGKTK